MTKEAFKKATKILLGSGLIFAGVGHLTFARTDFQAQVPNWVPLTKDVTVILSGLVETVIGGALILAPIRHERTVGLIVAGLFIAVFPGNLAQYNNKISAFGLDTDSKRFARLLFQPFLVFWALKSSGNLNQKENVKVLK